MPIEIRPAIRVDAPLILSFIRDLARYEKLEHEVVADESKITHTLFDEPRRAEVVIAEHDGTAAGFALFFTNYSTFLAQPGLYLEDLFVPTESRGHGIGRALLIHLAKLAVERGYGRFEWCVLDWNEPALGFYKVLGATAKNGWLLHRVDGEALSDLAQMK